MGVDADTMLRDALLLERAGRLAEAISAYERLLSRWPDRPDTWYNLALLQRKARRFEAALASYQQALNRGVTQPEEVHLNRGVIYADYLRRDSAAEAELRAALELNPRYVPALLNLANLDEDLGRRDQARANYERILEIDPDCHLALARLSGLASVSAPDDPLIARLRGAIERTAASPADRASLGFALGRVLDSCGAYEQAFDAYQAANRASRESAGPAAQYDRQRQERLVDALIAAFPRVRDADATPPGGVKPIFVCGMFRSGSTLTEQVLAAHPRVVAGGEIDFIPLLVRTELAPYPASMTQVTADVLAKHRRPLCSGPVEPLSRRGIRHGQAAGQFPLHRADQDAVSGRPHRAYHSKSAGQLPLDLLPASRPRHELRARSAGHRPLLPGIPPADGALAGALRRRTSSISTTTPTCASRGPAVERLLAFCGLEPDENCLRGSGATGAVKTASVWQVREPLHERSSGRWRNYARQLAALEADLGDIVAEGR